MMSQTFMHHEGVNFNFGSLPDFAEGICGNPECLEILGVTSVDLSVSDSTKKITLVFKIIPDRYRVSSPIIGKDLFEQISVGFGIENANLFTFVQG